MTTAAKIAQWFEHGLQQQATHMLIICDTFDHSDYPVYATGNDAARAAFHQYDEKNMQRVIEVYDLREGKAAQLAERRVFRLPQPDDDAAPAATPADALLLAWIADMQGRLVAAAADADPAVANVMSEAAALLQCVLQPPPGAPE